MAAKGQPYPSVWARPERRRREQPALSREQIVAEALAILDAEGLEALSMRKLGTRLNAGATSMYSHVTNKDELIELVLDEVYGEIRIPLPEGPDGWREAARSSAHAVRAAVLRHPWMASVLGDIALASLGPNVLRMSEDMLTLFETSGFTPEHAGTAMNTLIAFVMGGTLSEAAWLAGLARSDQDEEQWMARMMPAAEAAVLPYPRVRRQFDALKETGSEQSRGSEFDLGLDVLLDGLALLRTPAAG
ncbi:TetR/AcrR family transcriptional regulator C-terminal domain-containing protein [Streptomyces yaizuensis]|uniref:TetR/AcrR family transcriptional regulator C-terminal domain-containing protein n=1 Tax=Streptomyces yaizuensis TaxID=2989713 RepID=A0ABQ5P1V7_9ACTN|nr:TetR/AcrR family transcriptional regulator C-terminal domain-containing protein [Streptomyces sp. YSPA8]GLF96587.1 TetR/AcrR family transcriptional regulator C-terminal domain-containing protein [Streptomyces sp. YSPA8]